MSDQAVIRTEGLTKRFKCIMAVDNLNLTVSRGEIFGFLGPNGSGKTTTIGMLLGLIGPTSGRVEVFGKDVRQEPSVLLRVGSVFEKPAFYSHLSARDNLTVFARMLGDVAPGRMAELLELAGLTSRAGDKVRNYSQGMKQRLSLACALLRDPELLLLDEPTNGLDPAGMKEVRDLIARLGNQGKTIFLSSHLLHEVEQVCQRVAIIKQGKILAQGKISEIWGRASFVKMRVSHPDRAAAVLRGLSWVSEVEVKPDGLLFVKAPQERAEEISAILAQNQVFISEMERLQQSLESFFIEVTESGSSGEGKNA